MLDEENNNYLENFKVNLRLNGGSENIYDYVLIATKKEYDEDEDNIRKRLKKFKIMELNPYGDNKNHKIEDFKSEDEFTCMCGKENIINWSLIKRKSTNLKEADKIYKNRLFVIGSVCMQRFQDSDENKKTRRICLSCEKPYRRSKKYQDCPKCRDKIFIDEQRKLLNVDENDTQFTDEFIIKNILHFKGNKFSGAEWLTPSFIIAHIDKPWDWRALSRNQNTTPQFVLSYQYKPWDWGWLSINPNTTPQFVLAHPDKSWNWYYLSKHPNTTPEFVLSHPELPWDWGFLSFNPNTNLDFVLTHPDKPWDWKIISRRDDITWNIVRDNPDNPWDYNLLRNNNSIDENQIKFLKTISFGKYKGIRYKDIWKNDKKYCSWVLEKKDVSRELLDFKQWIEKEKNEIDDDKNHKSEAFEILYDNEKDFKNKVETYAIIKYKPSQLENLAKTSYCQICWEKLSLIETMISSQKELQIKCKNCS